jgi:hypothetical protein
MHRVVNSCMQSLVIGFLTFSFDLNGRSFAIYNWFDDGDYQVHKPVHFFYVRQFL